MSGWQRKVRLQIGFRRYFAPMLYFEQEFQDLKGFFSDFILDRTAVATELLRSRVSRINTENSERN